MALEPLTKGHLPSAAAPFHANIHASCIRSTGVLLLMVGVGTLRTRKQVSKYGRPMGPQRSAGASPVLRWRPATCTNQVRVPVKRRKRVSTALCGGSLGSCVDEERS